MVAQDRHDNVRWMAPHPLWLSPEQGLNGAPARPAILRFSTDTFMDEMVALTATRPEALPAWLAVPETWQDPSPEPPRDGLSQTQPLSAARARATGLARLRGLVGGAAPKPPVTAGQDLKLYQPAQSRFYMVAAQLVCARPGLPDRRITAAKEEGARYVIRRLVPASGTSGEFDPEAANASGAPLVEEYAFIPRGEGGGWWRRLAPEERGQLIPEEERQGLFPTSYNTEGRKRRLLLGTLPVARREVYVDAPLSAPDGTAPPSADPNGPSPRALLWQTEVTAPWTALREQAEVLQRVVIEDPSPPDLSVSAATLREEARAQLDDYRARAVHIGWLILADTRRFLQRHLPILWADLNGLPIPRSLTFGEAFFRAVLNAIDASTELVDDFERDYPAYDTQVEGRFVDALLRMTDADVDLIERADTAFEWPTSAVTPNPDYPDFLWIPAHPGFSIDENNVLITNSNRSTPQTLPDLVGLLETTVETALPDEPTAPVPALSAPPEVDRTAEPWFTVRCVFERPNCVGFGAPVVSSPSAPFRMAAFFDPDAPARDIRIPMPLDLSPAGLRKFRKGAGFIVSDMFCGQFNRFKSVTLGDLVRSVLPWPLHKDLPGGAAEPCGKSTSSTFGLMISLSIPIVTICAFILMMIMVTLLDIVFRWLPYLLTVFRIQIKGKPE